MRCSFLKKGLILGIILLFVGASVVPYTGGETNPPNVEYWALLVTTHLKPTDGNDYADKIEYVLCNFGWKEDHIMRLWAQGELAKNPFRKDVFKALEWLDEHEDSDDVVLIWIASHGDVGYFSLGDWEELYYEELDKEIDKLESEKIAICISACYSGSAITDLTDEGRIIITSCGPNETSGGIPGHTLPALQGHGDYLGNGNTQVSMEEMFDFLWKNRVFTTDTPQMDDRINGELDISFLYETDWNPDQYSTFMNTDGYGIDQDRSMAQSFKPSQDKIDKLKLRVYRRWNPGPLIVSIRDDLDGSDLTSVEIPAKQIFTLNDLGWTRMETIFSDFYLPEINVTPNNTTYYIVLQTESGSEDNYYVVQTSFNLGEEEYDAYEYGCTYWKWSESTPWEAIPYQDFIFSTYDTDNTVPNQPSPPAGPESGHSYDTYTYITSTTDLDGDQIYYWLDGGDSYFSGWIGPYASGETAYIDYVWRDGGVFNVRVKARDEYGDKSYWSDTSQVTIIAPELECEGEIRWDNVIPGQIVRGSFTVSNIGDPETLLDWEIFEWPKWGSWSFTPICGEDLTPEEGPITVEVTVRAPLSFNHFFSGEINISNADDFSDRDTIPVRLITISRRSGVPEGTQITMAQAGPYTKNIENIVVGDLIQSYNLQTQQLVPVEVTGVHMYTEGLPDYFLVFNDNLEISPNHTLFIEGSGWMEANDTELGYCMLENPPGTPEIYSVPILSKVEKQLNPTIIKIYDLEIQPLGGEKRGYLADVFQGLSGEVCGYWANGILVGGYN